jgi:hypothetical protein
MINDEVPGKRSISVGDGKTVIVSYDAPNGMVRFQKIDKDGLTIQEIELLKEVVVQEADAIKLERELQ